MPKLIALGVFSSPTNARNTIRLSAPLLLETLTAVAHSLKCTATCGKRGDLPCYPLLATHRIGERGDPSLPYQQPAARAVVQVRHEAPSHAAGLTGDPAGWLFRARLPREGIFDTESSSGADVSTCFCPSAFPCAPLRPSPGLAGWPCRDRATRTEFSTV